MGSRFKGNKKLLRSTDFLRLTRDQLHLCSTSAACAHQLADLHKGDSNDKSVCSTSSAAAADGFELCQFRLSRQLLIHCMMLT